MIAMYCCDIPKGKDMSASRQRSGKLQPCVKCHSTYNDRVRARKSSSRVVAEMTDRQCKIEKSREELRV